MTMPDGKPLNDDDADAGLDGLQPLELPVASAALPTSDEEFDIVITDDPVEAGAGETSDVDTVLAEEGKPPEVAAPETEEADEADLKTYTPNVQKRIQREVRIRHKAEQAANIAIARVKEVQTYATKMAADAQAAYAENLRIQKEYAEVLAHAFGDKIELKKRELKAARDAGEFDTEQKVTADIDDLRFKQNQIKETRSRMPETVAPLAPPPTAAAPATAKANPVVAKWLTENSSWFNHARFAPQREATLALDKALNTEGYDQASPEYYKELDRRVDLMFPTLRRRKSAPAAGAPAPVAGVSVGAATRSANRGRFTMTRAELASMSQFNLDPTNKLHMREYALQLKAARGE